MYPYCIKTSLVDEASDAFRSIYFALTSELCPSLRFTTALFPQVSSGSCHSLEDSLADSLCPRLYKVKNISPLWRHCGPNSALKVLLIPDTGEATSKIKLDLLSLKIRILHCLKEGGIQKWKTAHRCLALRERENNFPLAITPERAFYLGNIYTIS